MIVLSNYIGPIAEEIRSLGVPVHVIALNRGPASLLKGTFELLKVLRRSQPDVIQTWMYHADLIGGLAGRLVTRSKIFWGIHNDLPHKKMKLATQIIIRICSVLSAHLPTSIICCSERARQTHIRLGYSERHLRVVKAGIDTHRFIPNHASRTKLREAFKWNDDTPIVGMVARFTPEKDLNNFCLTAVQVLKTKPATRFILCGQGMVDTNAQLVDLLKLYDLNDFVKLVGTNYDVVELMQGFSVSMLSSSTESFGLVIAESLACGTVAVGTDVGEIKNLILDNDLVVPVGDPSRLARACLLGLAMAEPEKSQFLTDARRRIEISYSVKSMIEGYQQVWGFENSEFQALAAKSQSEHG